VGGPDLLLRPPVDQTSRPTATTIVLTGVSYPHLLAATPLRRARPRRNAAGRPAGEGARSKTSRYAAGPGRLPSSSTRSAGCRVALANLLFPGLALTATIAVTCPGGTLIALLAAGVTPYHPLHRLGDETRGSLAPRTPSSPSSARRACSCSPSKPWGLWPRLGTSSPRCPRGWSPRRSRR
jgi:hypothetical protein